MDTTTPSEDWASYPIQRDKDGYYWHPTHPDRFQTKGDARYNQDYWVAERAREIRTSYEVRVVGQPWMGGTAAMSYTVPADAIGQYPMADGETATEYEARMVECGTQTGDFQCIDAWEITRHESWTERDAIHRVLTHHSRQTTIVPFDEDAEFTYHDCMYGNEDEG